MIMISAATSLKWMKSDLYYAKISNMILSQYQKHGLVKQLKMTVPNYTIFRKDCKTPNSRDGGVAFYVSNSIKVIPRFDLSSEKIELLWLEITTNNKTLLIGVCYRPPGQNRTDATLFLNELELSLENVKTLRSDVTILMGDFNDKCNSWDDDHSTSELGRKLYDLSKVNTYNQLINEPTR